MLGSRPLDALSVSVATSVGVRCPSHVSINMFMATVPISMACPDGKIRLRYVLPYQNLSYKYTKHLIN